MLLKDQPLYLPKGSIRSILALIVTVAYFLDAVSDEVLLLVLGSYFVGRAASEEDKSNPHQDSEDPRP